MFYQPTLTRFSWSTLLLLLLSLVPRLLSNVYLWMSYFLARLGAKKEHSLSYVTDEQQRLTKKEPSKSVHYLIIVVLILGTFSCNSTDEAEETLGDWDQINSGFPGVARNAAIGFTIDDVTYVGLGFDGNGERLSDFWAYNPSQGYWDNLGRLATDSNARFPGSARNGAVAFALNGKGYVGLGDNDQDYLADFYEYNPTTRSWRKLADFPGGARRGAVAFTVGDKAYVGTGYNDNYLVDFWSYNPSTDTWAPVRDFGGSKREGAVAVGFNGKGYVGFGNSNGVTQKNLYTYDPQSNTWAEVESLGDDAQDELEARASANIFVLNNRIFFFGGTVSGYYQGDIWAYDPALDTWTEHTALTNDCGSARATSIAFAYNGQGYVTTGTGGAGRFDDLWVFTPDAEQVDCD